MPQSMKAWIQKIRMSTKRIMGIPDSGHAPIAKWWDDQLQSKQYASMPCHVQILWACHTGIDIYVWLKRIDNGAIIQVWRSNCVSGAFSHIKLLLAATFLEHHADRTLRPAPRSIRVGGLPWRTRIWNRPCYPTSKKYTSVVIFAKQWWAQLHPFTDLPEEVPYV